MFSSIIAKSLKTRVLTEADPFGTQASFGFPVIDFTRCTACEACARACPTGAIHAVDLPPPVDLPPDRLRQGYGESAEALRAKAEDGSHEIQRRRKTLTLSYAACIQCRACVSACGEQAVSVSTTVEIAAYARDQLAQTALYDVDASGRATFSGMAADTASTLEDSATRLRERIQGRLGRSLHVRQVDAGSCNGCELEIAATTNPFYDLERFGIHLVASPRHADMLLVTGPVTRNMEIALRRTYEAAPEPRVVVAVGACGCSGGIFGEGTYAAIGGVDRVLPVDVYIPGCPPRPQAILNGLLVAMDVREARARPA
jgi:Ni,Fe-hydrogenase III small subunit/formate hydrogenlyase subunit 6/NADH:ubiquinone oxidoreductase subunit I